MKKTNHDSPEFEYNKITEQIFIGTNFCCQVHFDEGLAEKGITTVVSIEGEAVDAPFGVEFFSWIPVDDHTAPSQDQLALGVSTLDSIITMGKKVYVHCKHGHGRAPTMVAAYFISKGSSVSDAVEQIKEKRPVIHLDDEQLKALEEFKETLAQQKMNGSTG